MARTDMFAKSGTANVSSTYGRRQDSLIVLDEVQITTFDAPVNPSGAYTGVYTWNAGQLMEATGAYASKINAATDLPLGMFYGDCNSTNDESVGGYITVISGPPGFRFSTNQIESGSVFAFGTKAYGSANGNITSTDGTGPMVAIAQGAADSAGFVDFIWALGYALT